MEIMCLVADRKELIAAIEETTGEKMKYQGPPTFAYKNEDLMVLRDGTLVVENIETRIQMLGYKLWIINYICIKVTGTFAGFQK